MDPPLFRTPLRPASASSRRTLFPNSSAHLVTPSRSSPLATPSSALNSHNPNLVTPNHSISHYATSTFPTSTPSCSSSSSSSSSSTAQPILIPTPKLGRFLRPLRAKLAHFRQAASSAPQAHRELVEPPTPSHRPIQRRSAASASSHASSQPAASPNAPPPVSVTYALRKSTRSASSSAPLAQPAAPSIPVAQLLSSVTASLGAARRAPAPPTRIPTPLRPSIASIQDAYRDVVHKTWRQDGQQGVLGQRQPLSLVDLAAFKLGDLIAGQCEDEEDAVDELEAVYADLPVHIRSRVLLQHATRLCIVSAHEPSILLGLAQSAFNAATRDQFVPLAVAAVAGNTAKVSLDVLTTIATLAAQCGRLESVLVPLVDALTAAQVQRSTFVQFARWAAASADLAAMCGDARWDLAVPGMVAARMVQVALQAESVVSDAVMGHLVEYVKVFLGVIAKVFAAEAEAVKSAEGGTGEVDDVMPGVWTERLVALGDALSGTSSNRIPAAITYPITVALLTLTSSSPNRALAHIPAQLAASLPALPRPSSSLTDGTDSDSDSATSASPASADNLLLMYQTTQPNFWLEAALALYSAANAHAHALAVGRYLLADMQDGDARCALEPHELAAWMRVIEKERVEAEVGAGGAKEARSKASVQASGPKSRSVDHVQEESSSTDEDSVDASANHGETTRPDEGYTDSMHLATPTPSVADSLPPATPIRLPPPPILTPTPARSNLPINQAPWYLTPVSTHTSFSSSAHQVDAPESTPCATQAANARTSRRTRTSSSTASENHKPTSDRPVRRCRKRSRSQDQVQQPPAHAAATTAADKGTSSRKSARTRTRRSPAAVSVQMSSSVDDDDDELTSGASRGKVGGMLRRVEIVDALSETDEPDEFLMM